MKTRVLIFSAALALLLPTAAFARDDEHEATASARPEQLEEHNGHFELRGKVNFVASDKKSFITEGKTIYIDPMITEEFNQRGLLVVGATVKVEGIVVSGKMYARELKVQRPGKPEFKEFVRVSTSSGVATPSATSTESATPATSSATLHLTAKVATASSGPATTNFTLDVTGTIQQVITALQNALNFLKTLI